MADIPIIPLRVTDPARVLNDVVARWERGDAVMPLDPSVPAEQLDRLIDGEMEAPEATALVMPTTGTTGPAKRVLLSHTAVTAAIRLTNEVVGAVAGDRWLCCMPPTHIGGMLTLLRSRALGSSPVIHDGFDVNTVKEERRARFVSLVPTMLQRLLDAGSELQQFDRILVGGARLEPSLKERATEQGARVTTTYGMTETCGGVVYDGFPLPGVDIEIRDGGRIAVRSPTLMTGYLHDADATTNALVDGWFLTQDEGGVDRDGRLRVRRRLDAIIVTGGNNVDPAEVAAALERHPRVERAAVRGEPDREWGQKVVAVIVPTAQDQPPSLEELHAFLEGHLPHYKLPRGVRYAQSPPKS